MSTMTSREEALFADALLQPAPSRGLFLARACGADAALLARLVALLVAHEGGESLLAPPSALATAVGDENAGDRIGHYKLLQKIGEGGCGVVWMAEQEEPVRRRVALKVIKLGMDTKAVVARFEAERQALAMMDHPNIAKVHDAGATKTGRPFFVMELVRGIPITKYCDENQLTPVARLELFIKVCHAIQHAHQKGIIHRDLKPSNILVTVNDGAPSPKIIDFGIAKATQGRLTDATVFTAFEQFIGTPAYMSPEQAEMSSLDIDTRSDIYSLGVLLYELLTGRPPFDPKTFAQAGVDQIRQQIREAEPPRPSVRLGTLDEHERSTIARLRSTAAAQLSLVLRGDLDWIVMRCIEKDRTRRYDTANGLAMDVQRYLRNEPVVARPPSTVYLLRKLVSRHKVGFTATAAVVAAIMVGSVLTTAQALRALRAERLQNELRETARRAEAEAAAAAEAARDREARLAKINWARETALPEINRLIAADDRAAAFKQAVGIRKYLPDDPALTKLWPRISHQATIQTTPPGARIYLKPYRKPGAEWEFLGVSPLTNVLIGRDVYRWRVEKDGFEPLEQAAGISVEIPLARTTGVITDYSFALDPAGEIPAGMVRVGAGTRIKSFFIDRFEVTNRQFKDFVDRGGYSDLRFSRQPFSKDGQELVATEVIATFRDASGKPGPATWRHGTYPLGQDNHPVTGVSWFEAAAYAESVGKRLPSIHHWSWASSGVHPAIVASMSNFGGRGLAVVGSLPGMSKSGVYDMAGNAKEWCWNEAELGKRYILGGAFDEAAYMFVTHRESLSPFDRSSANGFRCAVLSRDNDDPRWDAPEIAPADPVNLQPVNDETFRIYRSMFGYDRTELEPRAEGPEEVEELWRRQKFSYRTGYGGERMSAFVYLPKDSPPPYQTVIYFPGSGALTGQVVEEVDRGFGGCVLRSGRALVFPIYKATFERGDGRNLNELRSAKTEYRDLVIQWSKDLGRTLDYVETRRDLQPGKVAYLGLSLGAAMGFIFPAVEDRLKASILVSGGRKNWDMLPEIDAINFASRVTVPTLMLNGRFDFFFLEPGQRQIFGLLGTPAEHKQHVLLDAGHVLRAELVEKEVYGWLDRYLGPVKLAP